MCEPATIALVATGIAAAGQAVNGYMGYKQKRFEAKVASRNAAAKAEEAARSIERQNDDHQSLARKYAALRGSQRAALAANGVDVDFGNSGEMLGDTQMLYGEDAKRLNDNYTDEIRGIDISAANFRTSASASKSAATGIAIGTAFNVGSTILGGVGQVNKLSAARSGV